LLSEAALPTLFTVVPRKAPVATQSQLALVSPRSCACQGSCKKHGKVPGWLAGSVAAAREWRAKGIRCLCYGTDIGVFQTALSSALGELNSDQGAPYSVPSDGTWSA
jgi:hypothetical protein